MQKTAKRKIGFRIIAVTVVVLCVVLGVNKYKLDQKYAALEAKEAYLEQQIAAEQERSEDIEEYSIYIQTKKFIKDFANTVMGLVDPDDVIIKEDN